VTTAIVGGGILGLTLAYRLAQRGTHVEVLEAAPELGGLAATHDYGPFHWDRFYHVILPSDRHLIGLLRDLGIEGELRWKTTLTGYHAGGRTYDMNGNRDFLRFPLLGWLDKARLAATVVYASRFADPWPLYRVTAEEWLTRWCGRRGYEVFWQPLLRAKFGPYHDRVAAVFVWASLTRLFGARSATTSRESMGYVRGGYRTILGALRKALEEHGGSIRLGTPVRAARAVEGGCELMLGGTGAREPGASGGTTLRYDQVYFTGPTRLAREIASASPELLPHVERTERENPTSAAYLGVACLVLALRRPLMPYYVLNIADPEVEATGVIGMANLVDPAENTAGLQLYYVPRYLDSQDERLDAPDDALTASLLDRGLKRLFPDLRPEDVVYQGIHRARLVQPLPLARPQAVIAPGTPRPVRPFQVLNTSMLTCATLNNNDVVGLVEEFVERGRGELLF
jgi:protoporphyrinogen oxidase